MACKRCGTRCEGAYCSSCAQDVRHGADGTDDTQPTPDTPNEYECTACGHRYATADPGACPECGAHRRRFVGPLGAP
jgi:hypothetical protein